MDLYEWMYLEKAKNRNFSQKKFAEKVGVHRNYLCSIAAWRFRPKFEVMLKIEELTGGIIKARDMLDRFVMIQSEPGYIKKSKEKK